MAVGHTSQRATGFSSRVMRNPGLTALGSGPYSTRSQTEYAQRSVSAADPLDGQINPSTNFGMPSLGALPSLWGPPIPVQPPSAGRSQTAAPAGARAGAGVSGNHPNAQRLDPPPGWLLTGQGATGAGAEPSRLTRTPSNVSAAGTWRTKPPH